MEKEKNIIKIKKENMNKNYLMIYMKEMENILLKMVIFIKDNLKMVYFMEKEKNIIQMGILNMMGIGLINAERELENFF